MGKGILTPYSSAADDAGTANPATPPQTGTAPAPTERSGAAAPTPAPQTTTLSAGNPLANATGVGPPSAPPIHANEAINAALMNAFRPIVPDQINSLLGPAIGHMQGLTPPISYYQPRQPAPIKKES